MLKAVKVRLYPNSAQQEIIHHHFGAARFVYNKLLSIKSFAYSKLGVNISRNSAIKHLTLLRHRENTSWLKEIDSQAIQQAALNLFDAYENFFRRTGEFPKFKRKHNSGRSYQIPQRVRVEGKKVYIPKVGWVKMKGWRNFAGKIKTVTVSYRGGQYFASILMDIQAENIPIRNFNTVGIDVGVRNLITDSFGIHHRALDLKREEDKLKRLQQILSRRVKFSKNWQKIKDKISAQHLRISSLKHDYLHKLSYLYSENQTVVVEGLNIKGMSKSAKGTIEAPGTNVSAKRGLNRSIRERLWGIFFKMLEYKLHDRGGQLVRVNPKFTSQRCNCCGHIEKKNRNGSRFVCLNCSFSADADVNAALNIRDLGVQGSNAFGRPELSGLN